jgi:hypothetical protein
MHRPDEELEDECSARMFYAKDIDGMDASLTCQNLPCIGVTARSPLEAPPYVCPENSGF